MIYLLDSNVVSETWKAAPHPQVLDFLTVAEWFVPVPVIAEIQAGAESSPSAARRIEINTRLDVFLRRNSAVMMDWDVETARTWGKLSFSPAARKQPQALWDSLIDAMAVRYSFTVATRNTADFRHAATFNPWTENAV